MDPELHSRGKSAGNQTVKEKQKGPVLRALTRRKHPVEIGCFSN